MTIPWHRAVAQNDGKFAFADGSEHVRTQDNVVIHPDGNVPIDLHAIADFTFYCIHVRTNFQKKFSSGDRVP
jgi:hypothetical protein